MPRTDANLYHSEPVEFSTTSDLKYTADHAALYVLDTIAGDRKHAAKLLPTLHSMLRDIGKTTFTKAQCDTLASLIGSYPELGIKSTFSNAPRTAEEHEYAALMNLTPLGQQVLKQKGGTK